MGWAFCQEAEPELTPWLLELVTAVVSSEGRKTVFTGRMTNMMVAVVVTPLAWTACDGLEEISKISA